jgi:hypothetical protein
MGFSLSSSKYSLELRFYTRGELRLLCRGCLAMSPLRQEGTLIEPGILHRKTLGCPTKFVQNDTHSSETEHIFRVSAPILKSSRSLIHERTISLRFLGIFLRVLILDFFYKPVSNQGFIKGGGGA